MALTGSVIRILTYPCSALFKDFAYSLYHRSLTTKPKLRDFESIHRPPYLALSLDIR